MGFLDRGKRPAPGRPSPVVTVSGSSGGGRIRPGAPLESVLRPPPDDANAATSGGRRARRNSKDMTAAAAAEIAMRQGRRGSKG